MAPRIHAIDHPLLILRRFAGKLVELVPVTLLLVLRQPPESWIVLKGALTLLRWQAVVAPQPVASVRTLVNVTRGSDHRRTRDRALRIPNRWLRGVSLRRTRNVIVLLLL